MATQTTEKNATLEPEVLALPAEQAQAEGKTVDDLVNEAARKLIETRRAITGLRSFIAENRVDMLKRGFTERDVIPAIKAYRKEKRER